MDGEFDNNPEGNVAPVVSSDIIVRTVPRISANKLAEFVLAEPARQKAIIKEAKFAKKAIILPYKKTRSVIPRTFSSDCLNIDLLIAHASRIEKENELDGISDWQRNDNKNSATALRKIAAVASELVWTNAKTIPITREGGLEIAGVHVSVQPEVVFSFPHRNVTKVGGIIINTAQSDSKSLDRGNGSYCVGDYLASLLFQMLLAKAHRIGAPLNSKCFAIDVFREKVHTAPANFKTLNKNLTAACEMIVLRWPTIMYGA